MEGGVFFASGELFGFFRKAEEDSLDGAKKHLATNVIHHFSKIFNCKIGITDATQRCKSFVELMERFDLNGNKLLDRISYSLMGEIVLKKYQNIYIRTNRLKAIRNTRTTVPCIFRFFHFFNIILLFRKQIRKIFRCCNVYIQDIASRARKQSRDTWKAEL